MREKLKEFSIDDDGQLRGYCESQAEINVLLTQLKCVGYSYSVRISTQQPKSSDASRSCPKFYFRLKSGSVDIRFFRYPFSVEDGSHRECILGPKYYKEKKGVPVPDHLADHMNPRKRLLDTKKSGCPATFSVKCIRVYPGYSIESEGAHPNIKKKVWS
ncbi:uncharacterized protein LOC126428365 [Schistocerca serialis cubense]|uniref:uncharacterized protein LOC126428365 n=1 Tax=Schistocerca serialis cubense TaxID=2023355 RepID=UPI00214E80B1|nr:uncharacterized protein LOC126428365 [Schistocerca serialis cubense]